MADPQAGATAKRYIEPGADNTVVMFAGMPSVDGPVFDAAAVCARLGPVYHVDLKLPQMSIQVVCNDCA